MQLDRLKYSLKWWDYHILLRLLCQLPLPLAYAAARIRARYRCRVRHEAREAARCNMQLVFPALSDAELNRNVEEFFFSPCIDEMETYLLPGLTPKLLRKRMWLEGFQHLDRSLDAGRGALLFSNHSAGGAMFLVSFGLLGYKVNVIGRSLNEEDNPLHPVVRSYARRRFSWIEGILGRPFISPGSGSVSVLSEKLRSNECVLTMLDVPPEIVRSKTVVQFLGRDCYFPSGFARMANEMGCPMIPCQKTYQPDWAHHKLVLWEPIQPSGNIDQDVRRCVEKLERMVLMNPSQWWVWDNLPMLWVPPTS